MPPEGFADPGDVLARHLDMLLPPRLISVSDCALEHRVLVNAGGGHVGRWSHELAPYLVEPMDVLTSREVTTTAVVGPGQSGKTSIAENWFLHTALYDPANLLWYMPTEEVMDHYLRERIQPMMDAHPELAERLGRGRGDNNLRSKRFRGMLAAWLHATASNLISKTAPRLVADEIDAYDEADPLGQLDVRRTTFGDASMILTVSHPDRGAGRGIMAVYEASDQRRWYWKCPHCGGVSTPCPGGVWVCRLEWPKGASPAEAAAKAVVACPHCGAAWSEADKPALNASGFWVALGQEIEAGGTVTGRRIPSTTAGFWIHGLMSPFVTWNRLAELWAEALHKLATLQDEDPLRQFVAKRLGEPYTAQHAGAAPLEADTLAGRGEAGWRLGTVPPGVRFLTAAVDVQARRFAVLVRGWSETGESWLIDRYDIAELPAGGEPSPGTVAEHWDLLVERVILAAYPLADDQARVLPVASVSIDSGGVPGVTEQARDFLRRARAKGLPRWRAMLVKGASLKDAPCLGPVAQEKDDQGRAIANGVEIHILGVHRLKDIVDTRLRLTGSGAGVMHVPADAPAAYFAEVTGERKEKGAWVKVGPNESWDLEVYNEATRQRLRAERVDWNNPPDWARPALATVTPPRPGTGLPAQPAAAPVPMPRPRGRRVRSRGIA